MRIELPEARSEGQLTVAEAIQRRRSRRRFTDTPLGLEALSQLLWAAQGATGPRGHRRAAPSAGAMYPMELFVAVGEGGVDGLQAGVYQYMPDGHALDRTLEADIRAQLVEPCLGQGFVGTAPVDVLMAAVAERIERRYAERAQRYVDMEAGHISQNIYLQAEALGLATVAVGAFHEDEVAAVFRLPRDMTPLYLMPIGKAV